MLRSYITYCTAKNIRKLLCMQEIRSLQSINFSKMVPSIIRIGSKLKYFNTKFSNSFQHQASLTRIKLMNNCSMFIGNKKLFKKIDITLASVFFFSIKLSVSIFTNVPIWAHQSQFLYLMLIHLLHVLTILMPIFSQRVLLW